LREKYRQRETKRVRIDIYTNINKLIPPWTGAHATIYRKKERLQASTISYHHIQEHVRLDTENKNLNQNILTKAYAHEHIYSHKHIQTHTTIYRSTYTTIYRENEHIQT